MSTRDSFEVEVDEEDKGLYKLNVSQENKTSKISVRVFWEKYGEKIILSAGIIIIAAISFEAGILRGQKDKKDPVVVNQPACAPCPKNEEKSAVVSENNNVLSETQKKTENQKCVFVASKNSNKYHLSTCQWAEKIKPENTICFSSAEEAQGRGYQGAKCCIK